MTKGRIKISDIAKAAGVSASTVSYVLSGKRSISEDVKQKVYRQIEEMGYRPNAMARSFVTNKTYTIGVYHSKKISTNDLFFLAMIVGMTDAIDESDYKLLILNEMEDGDPDRFTIPVDRTFAIDGAIICNTRNSRQYLSELEKEHIPFVLLGKAPKDYPAPFVDNDNQSVAYKAVERFFTSGRKNVAIIMDNYENRTFSADVMTAYTMAHNDYVRPYKPELIIRVDPEQPDYIEKLQNRLIECNADAAVITSSLLPVMHLFLDPDSRMTELDIVIFAFDLYKDFFYCHPSRKFFYVNSNAYRLGFEAAVSLLALLDGRPMEKSLLLEQDLHER